MSDLNDPIERAKALEHEKHVLRIKAEAKRAVEAEEHSKVDPPEILTLRERLARPRTTTRWRIAQCQAVGHRVLLAAQFKAGKTTLAANVARSVLDGDAFLDTYDTVAIEGVLVLFDFEMSDEQLDNWYLGQKIANDDRLLVIPMRGSASLFNILDPIVRGNWATRLKTGNVKYLILDCLRPVFDALGLNEHTEAGLFLTALDALLREADIPEALVIQHMGHKNERARGDSRLLDWPDVGWTLVRAKPGKDQEDDPAGPRFFKAYGRDIDVPETKLSYDATTRRLTIEGSGSRANALIQAALTEVYHFVESAKEPPSGRQIEEMVKTKTPNLTQKAIREALRLGLRRGLFIEMPGKNGGKAYRVDVELPDSRLLDSLEI